MKNIRNLPHLLVDQLQKTLASEEEQLVRLPILTGIASFSFLKSSISSYREIKKRNIDRLNKSLDKFGISKRENKCGITRKLIGNCASVNKITHEKHVADAALIAAMQQISHFNIVNYGTTASYADALNRSDISKILREALEDEKEMDNHLSHIARESVNPSAVFDGKGILNMGEKRF